MTIVQVSTTLLISQSRQCLTRDIKLEFFFSVTIRQYKRMLIILNRMMSDMRRIEATHIQLYVINSIREFIEPKYFPEIFLYLVFSKILIRL